MYHPVGMIPGLQVMEDLAREHMERVRHRIVPAERRLDIVIDGSFDAATVGSNGQTTHIGKQAQKKRAPAMPVAAGEANTANNTRRSGRRGQSKPHSTFVH